MKVVREIDRLYSVPLTNLAQVKLLAGDQWCQVSGGSGELEGIYLDRGLTNSQIQMSEIV